MKMIPGLSSNIIFNAILQNMEKLQGTGSNLWILTVFVNTTYCSQLLKNASDNCIKERNL